MFIRIERASGVPVTRQVIDQIRMQYASGAIKPGERLPSVREMARDLAVNQNTILRVYEILTMEGLLERRQGDGTFVAEKPVKGQLQAQNELLVGEARRLVYRATNLGLDKADVSRIIDEAFEGHSQPAERGKERKKK
jgi:GntR family transcriptional regulator